MWIYCYAIMDKDVTKSLVVVSKKFDNFDGGQETEIAAQVTITPDGGWRWVVMVASFLGIAIIDGITGSFGPLLPEICKDLKVPATQGAFINSLQIAVYLFFGPVASALINNFGFRTVGMAGSIICGLSTLAAYFSKHYTTILIFYGFTNGLGCSLIFVSSSLISGFYFEKLRSIILPVVSSGSSIGIMAMYQIHVNTVTVAGWRTTVLLQAGLFGVIYFLALTYRPLTSLTIITQEEGNPTRTVTFLPNIEADVRASASRGGMKPSAAERAMRAVSNAHFPTAASIVETTKYSSVAGQAGTSDTPQGPGNSRITLKAQHVVQSDQIKKMQSIISTRNLKDVTQQQVEITIEVEEEPTGKSCFGRCCAWQSNPNEARPMYRDDIFYQGKLQNLPDYQKSVKELPEELKNTGLEYQLAVSRAVTIDDLKDRKGICSMAVRRTLATILDPELLAKPSFIMFCMGGLFIYSGILVPLIFLQARGLANGLDPSHCTKLVSVLSISSLVGRVIVILLALKIETLYIFSSSTILAGILTITSSTSYTPAFQYSYAVLYGLCIAGATSLRGPVIVDNYGLEHLTNAFGMAVMFNGIAAMYCPPLAAFLADKYGYEMAFYVAGGFITLSGVSYLLVKFLRVIEIKKEKQKENEKDQKKTSKNQAPSR